MCRDFSSLINSLNIKSVARQGRKNDWKWEKTVITLHVFVADWITFELSDHTGICSWQRLLLKPTSVKLNLSSKCESELITSDCCSWQQAEEGRWQRRSERTKDEWGEKEDRKRKQWTCEMEIQWSLPPLGLQLLFTAPAFLLHSKLKSMNIATASSLL